MSKFVHSTGTLTLSQTATALAGSSVTHATYCFKDWL